MAGRGGERRWRGIVREHDRWEDTPAVKIVRGGSGGASSERRSSDGGGKGRRGLPVENVAVGVEVLPSFTNPSGPP